VLALVLALVLAIATGERRPARQLEASNLMAPYHLSTAAASVKIVSR